MLKVIVAIQPKAHRLLNFRAFNRAYKVKHIVKTLPKTLIMEIIGKGSAAVKLYNTAGSKAIEPIRQTTPSCVQYSSRRWPDRKIADTINKTVHVKHGINKPFPKTSAHDLSRKNAFSETEKIAVTKNDKANKTIMFRNEDFI
ncbi:MAG: hypothetical protein H0U87_03225 [Acidobacteria bacterium]|jgi:hypothetical protein|nr:hypothetical protein [Acidobacteriota bacterium]